MSDCFFDASRATGEYPRKGYGWQGEAEQRAEIERKVATGMRAPWILREAGRFGINIPDSANAGGE